MTASGAPRPAPIATAKTSTSPRFAESRKATNLRMLSPIRRPSATAATIVAKSSSVSTIADASRAASVPAAPIATPTSARRSAGASFTPSPVTATTSPALLQRLDERELVGRGGAREDGVVGEPERAADRAGGGRVVAGDHAHPDPGARAAASTAGPRGRAQGVVQRDTPSSLRSCSTSSLGGRTGRERRAAATASTRRPSPAHASAASSSSGRRPVGELGEDLGPPF